MGFFDIKGNSGSEKGWNYAYPDQPNYMPMIEGTVVELSNPQSINYVTRKPEFWDNGDPKRNACLTIKGRSGKELNWVFNPKKSVASNACLDALDPNGTKSNVSLKELLGKFVRVQTQEGVYNQANRRPWWVTILGDGDANAVRGVVDLSQQQQAPAPQANTGARNNFGPPPAVPQAAPQQVAPQQIEYAQQQAAQALGYQQAPTETVPYEDDPTGGMYSEDIPF